MQLIKRSPALGLLVLGLALSAVADAASVQRTTASHGASAADRKLQALYSAEWQWRNLQYPDYEDTHKPVEDHLPKVDPASQLERLHYWQGVLQQLLAIHRSELSAAERLNYDIYRPQIETLISSQQFQPFFWILFSPSGTTR